MSAFVGRSEPLARLTAAYQALTGAAAGAIRGATLVLVTGEAGIGKTALLNRFAAEVAARGATVVRGICWDGDQAPAWWPWTQALRTLLHHHDGLRVATGPELAAIVPDLATDPPGVAGPDAAGRMRVFDAAGRLLFRAAAHTPVVVILDDLHWADRSTVDLMRFVAQQQQSGPLLLVGAYRSHEPDTEIATVLGDLAVAAELVTLRGLLAADVADLAQAVTGTSVPPLWAPLVHERSGGHPFFARELCHLFAAGGTATEIPAAVREVIARRLTRVPAPGAAMLDAAAVAGTVLPDVLADVCGIDPTEVAGLAAQAAEAGILTSPVDGTPARFVHDLYRETVYDALAPARRLALHHRVATALLRRHDRGSPVFPAELARHFAAAIGEAGHAPAVTWAQVAAEADAGRYAFVEAAGHLARVRSAAAEAGQRLTDADLVGLLTVEADLRLRAGDAARTRLLLDDAWTRASAMGVPELLGAVALGLDQVGARFAMPRTQLVAALHTAHRALTGSGTPVEAQVTAALARQLQHSVPADRPRAQPLAEQAVALARSLDDPVTLASSLLAHHDTLWTPGTATARAAIAFEIAGLAQRATDPQRHAQALLLAATAQLENGSPAFRATLAEHRYVTERLRQPRHDYLLRTRHAALALLDGDIDTGERLSVEAETLGYSVGDSDAGNVRMSQRLEIVRARNDPDHLRDLAAEAVRWWIGAPAHAHAVAAGFLARAGDIEGARRELDTVLALDWRSDRSYLWSIFVGELAVAAIAQQDRQLCQQLLDDLYPVADTCAVNGALVCFMGGHAHRVGLLHAALGQRAPARQWLEQGLKTHQRLGARAWQLESHTALAALNGSDTDHHAQRAASLKADLGLAAPIVTPPEAANDITPLRIVGDMWQATYRGRTVFLRDTKGMHDLAALIARPDVDVPAIELARGTDPGTADPTTADSAYPATNDPVLDRTALAGYRRRLAELDDDLDTARSAADIARQRKASDEREQLLAELRRATRPGGAARPLAATAAERARKAVTARIRDAIGRITDALPDLGAHLDRTIRTGTTCRYSPRA